MIMEFSYRWEPKDPAENPESHCSRRETRRAAGGSDSTVTTEAPAGSSAEPYRRSLRRTGFTNPWHLCVGSQVEAGARENSTARIAGLRRSLLWTFRDF